MNSKIFLSDSIEALPIDFHDLISNYSKNPEYTEKLNLLIISEPFDFIFSLINYLQTSKEFLYQSLILINKAFSPMKSQREQFISGYSQINISKRESIREFFINCLNDINPQVRQEAIYGFTKLAVIESHFEPSDFYFHYIIELSKNLNGVPYLLLNALQLIELFNRVKITPENRFIEQFVQLIDFFISNENQNAIDCSTKLILLSVLQNSFDNHYFSFFLEESFIAKLLQEVLPSYLQIPNEQLHLNTINCISSFLNSCFQSSIPYLNIIFPLIILDLQLPFITNESSIQAVPTINFNLNLNNINISALNRIQRACLFFQELLEIDKEHIIFSSFPLSETIIPHLLQILGTLLMPYLRENNQDCEIQLESLQDQIGYTLETFLELDFEGSITSFIIEQIEMLNSSEDDNNLMLSFNLSFSLLSSSISENRLFEYFASHFTKIIEFLQSENVLIRQTSLWLISNILTRFPIICSSNDLFQFFLTYSFSFFSFLSNNESNGKNNITTKEQFPDNKLSQINEIIPIFEFIEILFNSHFLIKNLNNINIILEPLFNGLSFIYQMEITDAVNFHEIVDIWDHNISVINSFVENVSNYVRENNSDASQNEVIFAILQELYNRICVILKTLIEDGNFHFSSICNIIITLLMKSNYIIFNEISNINEFLNLLMFGISSAHSNGSSSFLTESFKILDYIYLFHPELFFQSENIFPLIIDISIQILSSDEIELKRITTDLLYDFYAYLTKISDLSQEHPLISNAQNISSLFLSLSQNDNFLGIFTNDSLIPYYIKAAVKILSSFNQTDNLQIILDNIMNFYNNINSYLENVFTIIDLSSFEEINDYQEIIQVLIEILSDLTSMITPD